ncbi:MAG: bifunctional phosphopantothenoylcysteine decarboxylase/phosphopantothenate--cysteine ligase CoaBC [Fibrobacterota bacterium]
MADSLHLLLGVSGGIAAYKVPQLIRLLSKADVITRVVLTRAAQPLVGLEAIRTVSGQPVFTDDAQPRYDMDHIRLSQWADAFLVCPATANTIAKLAAGIGDNLLTTLALSCEGPLLVAPAMNTSMWNKPVTRQNLSRLSANGGRILPVGSGELACGTSGSGRLLALEDIVGYVLGAFQPQVLQGKKVLISSGPTLEAIDPVRVLTNRSSGKMGCSLARAALNMGAEVTVISGPTNTRLPEPARCIYVESTEQMRCALNEEFDSSDICIMAAAVSDYRSEKRADRKLSREENRQLSLNLVANPDIAAELGNRKGNRVLIGFALETEGGLERAYEKMIRKNCDMIVYNRVGESLGTETTCATMILPDNRKETIETTDKLHASYRILRQTAHLIAR